jgi:hypothetical protein
VAVVALVSLSRDHEPSYNDRALSDWLVALTNYNGDDDTDQVVEAIRQIGTNAIPYLVQYIRYTPSPLRLKSAAAVTALSKRLGRDWRLRGSRSEARAQGAFDALAILGPSAVVTLPDLTQLAADPGDLGRASRALFTLSFMGAQALPPLMAILTNQQSRLRPQAAMGLSRLDTNARPAVTILIDYLRDPKENLAALSAMSLGKMRQEPSLVIPALITALQDPRPRVRWFAAGALGQFGDLAGSAVPALLELLNDTADGPRQAATNALQAIAPKMLTNAPPAVEMK